MPEELRRWTEIHGGAETARGEGDGYGSLEVAGARALYRALTGPGRDRETAYALLAADALLTAAASRAADADDPDAALLSVIDALRGGREG